MNSTVGFKTQAWPADRVERRPVADLIPYARNARTHSEEQVGQVAASIKQWGWTSPVLIDEDSTIIAGHCRVLAAQKLGLTDVPVMIATGWTDAQRRAYVLADNKLAINAGWDTELLQIELGDLASTDELDMGLIGFSTGELKRLLEREEDAAQGELSADLSYKVIVECDGEREQLALIEKLESEGLKCQPLIS